MSEANPQTIDQAQAAFDAAKQALEAAQHAGGVDAAGAAVHAATRGAIDPFLLHFAIFALTALVGYFTVCAVTPALHRPLLSLANAMSAVIVVGAMVLFGADASVVGDDGPLWGRFFGFVALILASASIFGGSIVTQRMLAIYRNRG